MQAGGAPADIVDALVTHYAGHAPMANLLRRWLRRAGAADAAVDASVATHLESAVATAYSVDLAAHMFDADRNPVRACACWGGGGGLVFKPA
jgi:hypothetical protein